MKSKRDNARKGQCLGDLREVLWGFSLSQEKGEELQALQLTLPAQAPLFQSSSGPRGNYPLTRVSAVPARTSRWQAIPPTARFGAGCPLWVESPISPTFIGKTHCPCQAISPVWPDVSQHGQWTWVKESMRVLLGEAWILSWLQPGATQRGLGIPLAP